MLITDLVLSSSGHYGGTELIISSLYFLSASWRCLLASCITFTDMLRSDSGNCFPISGIKLINCGMYQSWKLNLCFLFLNLLLEEKGELMIITILLLCMSFLSGQRKVCKMPLPTKRDRETKEISCFFFCIGLSQTLLPPIDKVANSVNYLICINYSFWLHQSLSAIPNSQLATLILQRGVCHLAWCELKICAIRPNYQIPSHRIKWVCHLASLN